MKIIFVFMLYILASSEAQPASDPYIRTQVVPDAFPYVGIIPHKNQLGRKSACAATVLNSHWVLTTAICVLNMARDLARKSLFVYAYGTGSVTPLKSFKQKRAVKDMIRHPKHIQGTLLFDHGVVKVRKAFVFDIFFTRVKFYSSKLETAQKRLYEIMYEFRQRRCEECKQPDFGKYDCKMVSWKTENFTYPHLRLMEVTLLSYDECDRVNLEFNVANPPKAAVTVCVQAKRLDKASPKGAEQLTPQEFYESADQGAPLICGEAGTDRYYIWATFSQTMHSTVEETKGKVAYAYFTSIESILYGYRFDNPYVRIN